MDALDAVHGHAGSLCFLEHRGEGFGSLNTDQLGDQIEELLDPHLGDQDLYDATESERLGGVSIGEMGWHVSIGGMGSHSLLPWPKSLCNL